MTTYVPCAGSPLTGTTAQDRTGFNPGNLTTAFTTGVFGTMPAVYEWYRGVVAGPSPSSTPDSGAASIYVNNKPVSFTFPVGGSTFSPPQSVLMRNGDELYFYWNIAAPGVIPPVVTLWFRYDLDVPANKGYTG